MERKRPIVSENRRAYTGGFSYEMLQTVVPRDGISSTRIREIEVVPEMPIYTYECERCGSRFEAKQSFQGASLTVCSTCEGELHRIIQPVGIVFKGSGFYVTVSRGKQSIVTSSMKAGEDKSSNVSISAVAAL